MMKKRYIAAGIGTALVLAFLALAIWIFPLVQTAFLLHDVSEFRDFRYEISMELEEENLSEQQKQLVSVLAWVLNGGESSGLSWEIAGRVSDGLIYGQIYCKGCSEPVTELYFRQEEGLINVEMLYDSIRKNVIGRHPLLGSALPQWEYGEFLSSAQVEEIFQVDLEELFQAEKLTESHPQSFWESFRMLLGIKRKKGTDGGQQFETELGDYQVLLELAKEENGPIMNLTLSDQTERKEVSIYTGEFAFQETEEIVFPDSLMEHEDVQQFAKLWAVIDRLQSMIPEI